MQLSITLFITFFTLCVAAEEHARFQKRFSNSSTTLVDAQSFSASGPSATISSISTTFESTSASQSTMSTASVSYISVDSAVPVAVMHTQLTPGLVAQATIDAIAVSVAPSSSYAAISTSTTASSSTVTVVSAGPTASGDAANLALGQSSTVPITSAAPVPGDQVQRQTPSVLAVPVPAPSSSRSDATLAPSPPNSPVAQDVLPSYSTLLTSSKPFPTPAATLIQPQPANQELISPTLLTAIPLLPPSPVSSQAPTYQSSIIQQADDEYTTVVVASYTTTFPTSTQFVENGVTYTALPNQPVTVSDCPCTRTKRIVVMTTTLACPEASLCAKETMAANGPGETATRGTLVVIQTIRATGTSVAQASGETTVVVASAGVSGLGTTSIYVYLAMVLLSAIFSAS